MANNLPPYLIIHGDCLEVLPALPKARMIFADPPDNIGQPYDGYNDNLPPKDYLAWLDYAVSWLDAPILWLSIHRHYAGWVHRLLPDHLTRLIIWHYTFGQHNQNDLASCYRCLFRVAPAGHKWNTNAIRVPSARQLKYNDKRADPRGRVPGDVWEFPRVCGTFKERRPWVPNQHPEALVERCVLMSTKPGDLVIDPFLGSGTTLRVCQRLDRRCIGIDISETYCENVSHETEVTWGEWPAIRATFFSG